MAASGKRCDESDRSCCSMPQVLPLICQMVFRLKTMVFIHWLCPLTPKVVRINMIVSAWIQCRKPAPSLASPVLPLISLADVQMVAKRSIGVGVATEEIQAKF